MFFSTNFFSKASTQKKIMIDFQHSPQNSFNNFTTVLKMRLSMHPGVRTIKMVTCVAQRTPKPDVIVFTHSL